MESKNTNLADHVRATALNISQALVLSEQEINNKYVLWFNALSHPKIDKYLAIEDVMIIHDLISNPKYSGGTTEDRLEFYNAILNRKGFYRITQGTNRMVYECVFDKSILLKVAMDKIGCEANLGEFRNQEYMKPYIPKTFDVTPKGTIAMCERVVPIKSREEFFEHADTIYDITRYFLDNNFILEDIGTNFFKNWGVRPEHGPVLLDYPYFYRVNENRKICNRFDPKTGKPCRGVIAYDDGFNYLYCTKCGTRYAAKDIGTIMSVVKERKRRKEATIMEEYPKVTVIVDGKEYHHSIASMSDIVVGPKEEFIKGMDEASKVKASNPYTDDEVPVVRFNNHYNNSRAVEKPDYVTRKVRVGTSSSTIERPNQYRSNNKFHAKFINDKWKELMNKMSKEYGFDPYKLDDDLVDFIVAYLNSNVSEYIKFDYVVLKNPTNKSSTSEDRDKLDSEIKKSIGHDSYYCVADPKTLIAVQTNGPRIDEQALLDAYASAIKVYYEGKKFTAQITTTKEDTSKEDKAIDKIISSIFNDDSSNDKTTTEEKKPEPVKQLESASSNPVAEDRFSPDKAIEISATQASRLKNEF